MFRSCLLLGDVRFIVLAVWATAFVQLTAAQNAPRNTQLPEFANGRLVQIAPPPTPLKLGEKAQISLVLHHKGLRSVATVQGRYLDPEHKVYDAYGIHGGDQTLPVLYRPDGSAYIELVPLRLGEIQLTLYAAFPDRVSDRTDAFLQVVPSDRKPEALIVANAIPDEDTDVLRINLDDLKDRARLPKRETTYLYPAVYYFDLPVPIQIDRRYARFAIRQDKDNPVIDFDQATGGMRPLRRGAAVVETSYGGLVKKTCVLVRLQGDVNDNRECEALFAKIWPTVSVPLKTTWTQNPYGISNVRMWQSPEFLTDRLEVTSPDHPVEFAQPLDIPIKTSGGKVRYYTVAQSRPGFTNPYSQRISPEEAGAPRRSIPLIPLLFDDGLVVITAHFADNGVSQRYFRLHVIPSCKGLKSIRLETFPMEDGYLLARAALNYEQLKSPYQLPDLKRMTYRIDRGAVPDVLRIEPDGRIRRVHAGDAVIVATYCGVTEGIVVNVREPVK